MESEIQNESNQWGSDGWHGVSGGNLDKTVKKDEEEHNNPDNEVEEPHEPSENVGSFEGSVVVPEHKGVVVSGGEGPDDGGWDVGNEVETGNGETNSFSDCSEDGEITDPGTHDDEHPDGLNVAHNTMEPVGTHGSSWELILWYAVVIDPWVAASGSNRGNKECNSKSLVHLFKKKLLITKTKTIIYKPFLIL